MFSSFGLRQWWWSFPNWSTDNGSVTPGVGNSGRMSKTCCSGLVLAWSVLWQLRQTNGRQRKGQWNSQWCLGKLISTSTDSTEVIVCHLAVLDFYGTVYPSSALSTVSCTESAALHCGDTVLRETLHCVLKVSCVEKHHKCNISHHSSSYIYIYI